MKALFLCDIDNTILFSWRSRREGDLCVEWIGGKEQGYLTPGEAEAAWKIREETVFCHVTTRSIEQTLRISWPERMRPDYSVVTNGGHLLIQGKADLSWRAEMEKEILPFRRELSDLYRHLFGRPDFRVVRIVDDSYLFVSCRDGGSPRKVEEELRSWTRMEVRSSGRKVYVFPPGISKGRAAEMLKARLKPRLLLAAGDSPIDVPMLRLADYALVPDAKLGEIVGGNGVFFPGEMERFPDFVFRAAADLLQGREPSR